LLKRARSLPSLWLPTGRRPATQGKADGTYPTGTADQYAVLKDVVRLSSQRIRVVPPYLPLDSTALFTAISTLMTYLECRMGTGNVVPCPEGTLFSPTDRVCVAAYIASPGNSTDAPAGCTKQSCACTGRANGIYSDPTGSGQSIMCIFQQPTVMQVGGGRVRARAEVPAGLTSRVDMRCGGDACAPQAPTKDLNPCALDPPALHHSAPRAARTRRRTPPAKAPA
jgi:hypothetical protein